MWRSVILTSGFPPQTGVIANHALHLANGLQAIGLVVKLTCDTRSKKGEEERSFDEELSFEDVRIPRKEIILISYLNRIFTAFSLTRKCEVVICSGKYSLWVGAFLSVFFKREFVAIIHGSE